MMRTHDKPFHNSGFYFIILLFLAVIGFWQSYFSKLFDDIDSYIHFHAITMLLWVGMLITQSFLIRFKKRSLHRFIGKLSYGLLPVLIISLILLAHSRIVIGEDGILPTRLYTLFFATFIVGNFRHCVWVGNSEPADTCTSCKVHDLYSFDFDWSGSRQDSAKSSATSLWLSGADVWAYKFSFDCVNYHGAWPKTGARGLSTHVGSICSFSRI